ncbi:MAG: glycosyltransferase family 1 protein [Actinobacteria bacterium]|nr:glycosyltransferase family 1 protein [Actinomycetota bacterium]
MTAQPRYALPTVPEPLRGLVDLALDMRWSWSHASDELWERLAPELWDITHNPWHILQTISQTELEKAAGDQEFLRLLEFHVLSRGASLAAPTWFEQIYPEAAGTADAACTDTASGGAEATPTVAPPTPTILEPPSGLPRAPAASLGPVAYFSMEFGLSEALPIYSGGLGILAGDFLKAASDLGVPLVGVGLLWQQGYFRQALNSAGEQIEFYPFNDPGQLPIVPLRDADGEWMTVALQFPRRTVHFRAWEVHAGRVRLYLLDSNHLMNSPTDRGLTSELYGGGPEIRLQQEMALGIGGWRLLRQLGLQPEICHLNEGHAALAVLERARSYMEDQGTTFDVALTATRAGNLFTTHTPVEAGFDRFSAGLVAEYLGEYAERLGIGLGRLLALGRCPANAWCALEGSGEMGAPGDGTAGDRGTEPFNMAYLAIRGSGAVNGVSRLHAEVSRGLFQCLFPRWPRQEVPIGHVTNGVHVPSWDSPEADALWTTICGKGRWLGGLTGLGNAIRQVKDEDLWTFRNVNRQKLVTVAREHVTRQGPVAGSLEGLGQDPSCVCDPARLTVGFARRFATYKRANLLLHDQARLERLLCGDDAKMQLVLAGKAHPADAAGKAMIKQWTDFIERCMTRPHVIFLVDYDMGIAEHLVHGVDVWLNTPRRPYEASGTSGMKILVNGGLNLSELDGWWAEAYHPDVGWAIGDGLEHDSDPAWDAAEAEHLYHLLENEIIPEFYDRDERGIPRRWIARVRESMARLTPQFSTNRMMQDYLDRYYLPGAAAYRERTELRGPGISPLGPAAEIEAWRTHLDQHWHEIAFLDYSTRTDTGPEGYMYTVRVELALGDISPDAIIVELYAEPLDNGAPERHVLTTDTATYGKGTAATGAYSFQAVLPATRPSGDYTPRVIPRHEYARIPLEAGHILWYR